MRGLKETGKVDEERKQGLSTVKKLLIVLLLCVILLGSLYLISPSRGVETLIITGKYAKEMLFILPAVLIIMGLADSWIPRTLIKKHLGEESGIKGMLIAFLLGTLPTGPMYIAFPIAGELIRKKARISNVLIFLGVWASLKIPQIGVEIQFLGFKFALLRLILTLIAVVVIGEVTDFINKSLTK